jgi:molecular chaperone DnaK
MTPLHIGLDCGAKGLTLSHLEQGLRTAHFWDEAWEAHQNQDSPSDRDLLRRLKEGLVAQANPPNHLSSPPQPIACLTIATTSAWQKAMGHLSLESLQDCLGSTVTEIEFVPDFVAIAAAWIGHSQKKQPLEQNKTLLICDLGRTATRIHLCQITPNHQIKMLYSDAQDGAGLAFDRVCVERAYQQKHGHDPDPLIKAKLLRLFDLEKQRTHDHATLRLRQYLQHPEAMADYALYAFGGGYLVNCHQVNEGFAPIQSTFQNLISSLQSWLPPRPIDHLILTGGFSRFWLARSALLKLLDMDESDCRFDRDFCEQYGETAIAYGASLIANREVDPFDRCPCTLGIMGETLNANLEPESIFIPILRKGDFLEPLQSPRYASTPLAAHTTIRIGVDTPPVKTQVINVSDRLALAESSIPLWHFGMQVNSDAIVSLVIEDSTTGQRVQYELGQLADLANGGNVHGR